MHYLLSDNNIRNIYSTMNINETELREDLGTFGGAVKNGILRQNFAVEKADITTHNGRVCLKCHMGRWFGKDDDIILFPDGTGINTDENASDREFQWTSVRVRTTSFAKSVLGFMAAGAAIGAVGPAAARVAAPMARKAGSALMWTGRAGNTAGKVKTGVGMGLTAAGLGYGAYKAGQADGREQEAQRNGMNEGFLSAGIGAAAGAAVGGLYALYKNRNNIIYYADGRYASRKGDIQGRWDGSVEEEQRGNSGNDSRTTTPSQTINVPGMPADFGKNSENVKIAQRYLVANHANISTKKSVDGIDGILGPRTKKAILAYMTQHKCDFAKFWKDAQEYSRTAQNVENLKKQNIETQMQLMQNKHLSSQGATQQQQQPQQPETVNEVRTRFYDIFNRMNNATILQ